MPKSKAKPAKATTKKPKKNPTDPLALALSVVEAAMLSFRDASVEKILKLGEWIRKLKGTVKPRLTTAKTSASN